MLSFSLVLSFLVSGFVPFGSFSFACAHSFSLPSPFLFLCACVREPKRTHKTDFRIIIFTSYLFLYWFVVAVRVIVHIPFILFSFLCAFNITQHTYHCIAAKSVVCVCVCERERNRNQEVISCCAVRLAKKS